jgi:hypothetical protein
VRYEAAWQQFRVASARHWLIFLGYLPAVLFFGWLLSFVFSDTLAHGIAALGWMVLWAVAGRGYLQFRCPRCGKKFFARDHFSTNLTGRCLNCGLPKYAFDRTVTRDEF